MSLELIRDYTIIEFYEHKDIRKFEKYTDSGKK